MDYYKAKALGVCPWCGKTPTLPHTYCDNCLEVMSPGRTFNIDLKKKMVLLCSEKAEINTPAVACCGMWHEIKSIPMTTACGHTYFVKK